MKTLLSTKTKRKLEKAIRMLWKKLTGISMESPMHPVWIPIKK